MANTIPIRQAIDLVTQGKAFTLQPYLEFKKWLEENAIDNYFCLTTDGTQKLLIEKTLSETDSEAFLNWLGSLVVEDSTKTLRITMAQKFGFAFPEDSWILQ